MSMTSDVLNPKGRLAPGPFLKYGLILVAIGFVIGLLPLVSTTLSLLGGLVGLVLIWPWIVIWVKRLHDAGKSGWLLLLVLVVYLIVYWIGNMVVTGMFGADAQAAAQAAAESGDVSAVWASAMAASRALALPMAIYVAVISIVILYLGNVVLKSDPGANRFGPPPAA